MLGKSDRLSRDTFLASKKNPIVLVLDNIRSGHNVGAAFRLSDALLLSHIYLCGITPKPPHPQIHKTALGAQTTVSWSHVETTTQAIVNLKKANYHIIAVEQTPQSIPLQKIKTLLPQPPIALVFGHEVFGIQEEVWQLADSCIEIPQYGTKKSLNVAMCMGIVTWELMRSLELLK